MIDRLTLDQSTADQGSPEQGRIEFTVKGDTAEEKRVTPQSIKGDTEEAERVTPEAIKGDTGVGAIRKEKELKEVRKQDQKGGQPQPTFSRGFSQQDFDDRDLRLMAEAYRKIARQNEARVGDGGGAMNGQQLFEYACSYAGISVARGLKLEAQQRQWPDGSKAPKKAASSLSGRDAAYPNKAEQRKANNLAVNARCKQRLRERFGISDPWASVKAWLRDQINPHSWDTWIYPTQCAGIDGGVLYVRVPTEEFRYGREKYADLIRQALDELHLEFSDVRFVLDEQIEIEVEPASDSIPRHEPQPERGLALVAGAR